MRLRPLPNRLRVLRMLLVPAVACAVTATGAVVADAGEDRTSRRSAEMALPDPYLDPAWPDEAGEEMEGRYAPGKSDSVEEVPLGDELEIQEELRALQEPTAETPPAATQGGDVAAPAPTNPEPYVPQEDDEEAPDLDQRDPVEW
jgi:hypothetical protein